MSSSAYLLPFFLLLFSQSPLKTYAECPNASPISEFLIIDEEKPVDSSLFNFTAESGTSWTFPNLPDYFRQETHQNVVSVVFNRRIDMEQAPYSATQFLFDIKCSFPNRQPISWKITATVNDVNEFAPQFRQASYSVNVPEDLDVGGLIMDFSGNVADPDYSNYSIQLEFSERDSLSEFRVTSQIRIVLAGNLDFDSGVTNYVINVTARERPNQGTPEIKASSTLLTVHVVDVDDLNPRFNSRLYRLSLDEGSYNRAVLSTSPEMTAQDMDRGINAALKFSLDGDPRFSALGNGSVLVTGEFDSSVNETFFLIAKAFQIDNPVYRYDEAVVFVTVNDIYDHSTVMSLPAHVVNVSESITPSDKASTYPPTTTKTPKNGACTIPLGCSVANAACTCNAGYIESCGQCIPAATAVPTLGTATPQLTSLTVTWSAHSSVSGVSGVQYQVSWNGTGSPQTVSGLSYTIPYLASGTVYSVMVKTLISNGGRTEMSNGASGTFRTLSTEGEGCTVDEDCDSNASLVCSSNKCRCRDSRLLSNGTCVPAATVPPTNAHGEERHDVECTERSMKISIPSYLLPQGNVTLLDPSCPLTLNGTDYVIDVGLSQCGTTIHFTDDHVVFVNTILTKTDTGAVDLTVPVGCQYPRLSNVSIAYMPLTHQARFFETNWGKLDVSMEQYKDDQFSTSFGVAGSVARMSAGQTVYLQIHIHDVNQADLGVMPRICVVSPSPSPLQSNVDLIIRNGCPVHEHVRLLPSPGPAYFRFAFNADTFRFDSGLVYVHCETSLCELGPSCPAFCGSHGNVNATSLPSGATAKPTGNTTLSVPFGRRRRSAELPKESGTLLSAGPLLLVDEADAHAVPAGLVATIASIAAAAMVVVVALAVALHRARARNASVEKRLTAISVK